jgi:hypothetical protein
MNPNKSLKNRSERSGNIVSIESYDNTSNAYKRESNQRSPISFSFYLTIAILVFLVIFFMGIYELIVETWMGLK